MAERVDVVEALRQRLVEVCRRAYQLGLVPGMSGNVSVRLHGEPGRVLIKATGASMGDMTAEDTVLVDMEGQVLEQRPARPSKELFFHLAIYRCRPEVGAVVHLHPPFATAFAAAGELPPLRTGAARAFLGGERLVLVPPAPSGSRELAERVEQAFRNPATQAALLAEHGTITVGPDLLHAFYLSQYLEDACRTAMLVRLWERCR